MGEGEVGLPPVLVLMGPGAHKEVMGHALDVLNYYGIPFQVADWNDSGLPGLLASTAAGGARVVIFGTGVAYTDEHVSLPEDLFLPVIKVITGPPPSSGQVLTSTEGVGAAGFGVPGAVNAGLFVARILATSDPALQNRLRTKPYRSP